MTKPVITPLKALSKVTEIVDRRIATWFSEADIVAMDALAALHKTSRAAVLRTAWKIVDVARLRIALAEPHQIRSKDHGR